MTQNLSDFNFIFFDLETTDLDVYKARILEIALIGSSGEQMLHSYVQYPFEITNSNIHGITQEVLLQNNARILLDVLQEMEACIQAKLPNIQAVYLVAYNNMNYDKLILEINYHRLGRKMPENWYFMDPYPQFKEVLSSLKLPSLKLTSVYQHYFNKELVNAHSALSDTRALYEVYLAFVNQNFFQVANVSSINSIVNTTESTWWQETAWSQMSKALFCKFLLENPLYTQMNIFNKKAINQKIECLGITGTCLRILKDKGFVEIKDLVILYIVVYPNFDEIIKKRTGLSSDYIVKKIDNSMKYITFLLYGLNDTEEKLKEVKQKIKLLD